METNHKAFFESLNPNTFRPSYDENTARSIKRQRKLEKRARRLETQQHRDKFSLSPIVPLTDNQQKTFDAFQKGKHLLLHGYAGTGKTFCAVYLGLDNIFAEKGSKYKKIIVVRSVVPARDMGYLPGSIGEKIRAYEEPYEEICDSLFGEQRTGYKILKDRGLIEFTTTSFLRGVTFNDAIVIVDEMQNMTFQELDTVMTRIGENCRIVFCGDFRQTDLDKDTDRSGLHKFMAVLHKLNGFEYIEFGREDIVRSSIVKDYIIARTETEDARPPRSFLTMRPYVGGWPLSQVPLGAATGTGDPLPGYNEKV